MSSLFTSKFLIKHGYLLLLIPPIGVYLIANVLFEYSVKHDFADLTSSIGSLLSNQDTDGLPLTLSEMRARYTWLSTILLNLVVCIYAAGLFGTTIYQSHRGKRLLIIVSIGILLIVMGIVGLLIGAVTQNALYQMVYKFSFSTLQISGLYQSQFLSNIGTILFITNILAIITPNMAILAFCSTVAPSLETHGDELSHLATQMRQLKGVLNAGSALLVSGILHMNAWLRWPGGLLMDPTTQTHFFGAVLAVTMFWGATFTLMLITTYGPAASYLSTQARTLAEKAHQAGTIQDPKQWLQDHHFSITLGEQLPQISVILGPVLAGPIGSFLMSSSNALTQ